MTDKTNCADAAGRDGAREVFRRGAACRGGRMGIVLAAGFAAAVSISLVALYVALRRQPERKPAEAPSVAAPAPARPPAPREPTIVLASIPVPASADQLKQESAFVAAALRERFPSLAQALHVVAMLHAQLRQSAEAEKLWRKCMELDPTNETYYVNVAAVAMDRGGSETAVETLERAIAAGCASRDIDYHLALGLMNLGRCDEAKAVMQKTLATYPNSSPCWVVLGQVQLKLGEAAEAEVSLRKSMNLGPPSASLYFALANACARQGKNDEAAKFRTLFNDLKGKQPVAAPERFQVLTTAEARRTAVAIHCEAATVHAWHGDFLEAEKLFLRAVALDPGNAQTCRGLAALYRREKMAAEEQVVRRRLVEIEPRNPEHYLDLASLSRQLGETESAEAVLKLALANDPESGRACTMLAQLCLQTGRAKQARWFAQEAVRREPTAEGFVLLASTCRLLGDAASADAADASARELASKTPQQPRADVRPTTPAAEDKPSLSKP